MRRQAACTLPPPRCSGAPRGRASSGRQHLAASTVPQERREGVRRQAASTLPPPRCSGAPRGRDTGQILARLDLGWILARASSGRQHLAASTVPQERREGEILGRFCVDTGWILARASSGRQHLAASTVPQDRRQGVRRQAACTLRTLPF